MSVKPVAVARKTTGRPAALDVPEGGWSWVAVSLLSPGDYVMTLDVSDDTVVEADAAQADVPLHPGLSAGMDALGRATNQQGVAWERLVTLLLRALEAKLPESDEKEASPWQAIAATLAPHFPQLLAALGPGLMKLGAPTTPPPAGDSK